VGAAGEHVYSERWLTELKERVRTRLAERAQSDPLDPGLPLAELLPAEPWVPHVVNLLELDRRGAKAYLPGAAPKLGEKQAAAEQLEAELTENGLARVEDAELAAYLEAEGRLKRVGDGFAVSSELYDRGRAALQALEPITLAGFRDALGISRRAAQLLLERYDADGLTLRVGDERRLRAAHRP
jgi:selenocysteine-specific elongation factor